MSTRKDSVTTVHLIRHGITNANTDGVLIGSGDSDLNEEGIKQAERISNYFGDAITGKVYSSPSSRALRTAKIASGSIPVKIIDELREVNFGDWEGMTLKRIEESDSQGLTDWFTYKKDFSFPNGESLAHFFNRLGKLAEMFRGAEEERIVAFTHGGVILHLTVNLLGLPPEKASIFSIPNGSITTLELFDGGATLKGIAIPDNPFLIS